MRGGKGVRNHCWQWRHELRGAIGRPSRQTAADVVYHVLNRANARRTLFEDDRDYAAFERVLGQACDRMPMKKKTGTFCTSRQPNELAWVMPRTARVSVGEYCYHIINRGNG
ncbi:hypothetical protein NITLEN_10111 [Nitrospira lenta]|uniref:Transposase n=1 Tax=Nitrospira lenta TaxID=1436998 RepID=A0A330KZU5_9BACT|nr:hypothetical protein NITLEN_10111 [Nitrospira lenta]